MLRRLQLRHHLKLRHKITSTTVVGGYSKEAYEHVSYFHIENSTARAGVDSLGEDAFYINTTLDRFDSYGVADGVGGWRNQGVDPSLFSSTLMRECLLASSVINNKNADVCPKQLIVTAIDAMTETHNDTKFSLLGSSTAITAIVDKDSERYG